MTATQILTYDCKTCKLPMARVLGPGVFRAAGLTVRLYKRPVEVDCPWCGAPNQLVKSPAVDPQDIPVEKPLDFSTPPGQDSV